MLLNLFRKIPSHWLALADQIFVSGSNFLIGIILARTFGAEIFGLYVIATTYQMYAVTFQSSLVVSPMVTALPHELDEIKRRNLVSGFLCCALSLSFLSVLGVVLIAHFLGLYVPSLQLGANTLPLMLAIVGFQLQDWLRKALYAMQKTESVLILDFMAYGGQLLSLAILLLEKRLTPSTALLSLGGAFLVAALVVLIAKNIVPSFKQAVLVAKTYWRGSRDFFISWQLQWASSQGLSLYGAGILGTQFAGALRATMNLVAPVNVIFQWMENVIPVRAVVHLKKNGILGMNKFLKRLAWVGGLLLAIMVVGLYFFAGSLLSLLYGEEYRQYAFYAVLQGACFAHGHFYRLEFIACRATNRTMEIAKASLIMAIGSIGFGVIGIHALGGNAIILALIFGQVISHIFLVYRRKQFEG